MSWQDRFLQDSIILASDDKISAEKTSVMDKLDANPRISAHTRAAVINRLIQMIQHTRVDQHRIAAGMILKYAVKYMPHKAVLQATADNIVQVAFDLVAPAQNSDTNLVLVACEILTMVYELAGKHDELRKAFNSEHLHKIVSFVSFHLQTAVHQDRAFDALRLIKCLKICFQVSAQTSVGRLRQYAPGIRSFVIFGINSSDLETRCQSAELVALCAAAEGPEMINMYAAQVISAYWQHLDMLFPSQVLLKNMTQLPVNISPEDDLLTRKILNMRNEKSSELEVSQILNSFFGICEAFESILKIDVLQSVRLYIDWSRLVNLFSCVLSISQETLAQFKDLNMGTFAGGNRHVEYLSFNLQTIQSRIVATLEFILGNPIFGRELERVIAPLYSSILTRLIEDSDLDLQNYFSTSNMFCLQTFPMRGRLFKFSASLLPWPYGFTHLTSNFSEEFLPLLVKQVLKDIELTSLVRSKARDSIDSAIHTQNSKFSIEQQNSKGSKKRRNEKASSRSEKSNESLILDDNTTLDLRNIEEIEQVICAEVEFLMYAIKSSSVVLNPELKSLILKSICSNLMDISSEIQIYSRVRISHSLLLHLYECLSACAQHVLHVFPYPSLLGLVVKLFQLGCHSDQHDFIGEDILRIRRVCADGLRLCEIVVHPRLMPKLSSAENFLAAFDNVASNTQSYMTLASTSDSPIVLHDEMDVDQNLAAHIAKDDVASNVTIVKSLNEFAEAKLTQFETQTISSEDLALRKSFSAPRSESPKRIQVDESPKQQLKRKERDFSADEEEDDPMPDPAGTESAIPEIAQNSSAELVDSLLVAEHPSVSDDEEPLWVF
jgi:hypothetical protein